MVSFNDMERPWVKIYNKYQPVIMTFLEREHNNSNLVEK